MFLLLNMLFHKATMHLNKHHQHPANNDLQKYISNHANKKNFIKKDVHKYNMGLTIIHWTVLSIPFWH